MMNEQGYLKTAKSSSNDGNTLGKTSYRQVLEVVCEGQVTLLLLETFLALERYVPSAAMYHCFDLHIPL